MMKAMNGDADRRIDDAHQPQRNRDQLGDDISRQQQSGIQRAAHRARKTALPIGTAEEICGNRPTPTKPDAMHQPTRCPPGNANEADETAAVSAAAAMTKMTRSAPCVLEPVIGGLIVAGGYYWVET